MEDCDPLIEDIDNRGMKIVMDMVLNHTSDNIPGLSNRVPIA